MRNRTSTLRLILVALFIGTVICTSQLIAANVVVAQEARVLRVIDGDTFVITYAGKKEKVRLLNVDTPESVHPDASRNTMMGVKASDYTKQMLENKYVVLEFEDEARGKYGRLLAYAHLQGLNFNIELVKQGFSPYLTKYGVSKKYDAQFRAAEQFAKSQGLNIWSLK